MAKRATLDQAKTIRAMAPTNEFFDEGDPRRVFKTDALEIDWRKICKVYMAVVLYMESVSFVDCISDDDLTEPERAAISEIEAEVKREKPK